MTLLMAYFHDISRSIAFVWAVLGNIFSFQCKPGSDLDVERGEAPGDISHSLGATIKTGVRFTDTNSEDRRSVHGLKGLYIENAAEPLFINSNLNVDIQERLSDVQKQHFSKRFAKRFTRYLAKAVERNHPESHQEESALLTDGCSPISNGTSSCQSPTSTASSFGTPRTPFNPLVASVELFPVCDTQTDSPHICYGGRRASVSEVVSDSSDTCLPVDRQFSIPIWMQNTEASWKAEVAMQLNAFRDLSVETFVPVPEARKIESSKDLAVIYDWHRDQGSRVLTPQVPSERNWTRNDNFRFP